MTEAEIANIYSNLFTLKQEIQELLGINLGTLERTSYIGRMWLIGGHLGGSIWFWVISVGACLGLAIFARDTDSDAEQETTE